MYKLLFCSLYAMFYSIKYTTICQLKYQQGEDLCRAEIKQH